jgi:predicted Rossmann fold nucleotide-binding protein DprA/Smf involved in DNA uptake
VDILARESGLTPQAVTALLVNLEIAGLANQRPGKNYTRA